MKKSVLVLVLVVFVAGLSFAQTSPGRMPRNNLTVDIGPTIFSLGFRAAGKLIENMLDDDDMEFKTSGFGIGAQYEIQLIEMLSIAGRVAFMKNGFGMSFNDGGLSAKADTNFTSFSVEGHARLYPFKKRSFFLDGMLGYGFLSLGLDGNVIVDGTRESVSETVSRNYLKYGGKLGWRIDFGKPGGFIFEPSLGFNGAVGIGKTLEKKILSITGGNDISDFGTMLKPLENFIFIGGPRVSLAFGVRF